MGKPPVPCTASAQATTERSTRSTVLTWDAVGVAAVLSRTCALSRPARPCTVSGSEATGSRSSAARCTRASSARVSPSAGTAQSTRSCSGQRGPCTESLVGQSSTASGPSRRGCRPPGTGRNSDAASQGEPPGQLIGEPCAPAAIADSSPPAPGTASSRRTRLADSSRFPLSHSLTMLWW